MFRQEQSSPTTSAPVKVNFQFLIGTDLFADVLAEVTEETDGDGFNTGHDVTILEALVPAKDKSRPEPKGFSQTEIFPYAPGYPATLLEAIEKKAVECSHNSKYHIKN